MQLGVVLAAIVAAGQGGSLMTSVLEGNRAVVSATLSGAEVVIRMEDRRRGHVWADGPYAYAITVSHAEGRRDHRGLANPRVRVGQGSLTVSGTITDTTLSVIHRLTLDASGVLQERITLRNDGKEPVELTDVGMGFRKLFAADTQARRLVAVPFRRQVDGKLHDYGTEDLLSGRFSNSDWANDATVADQQCVDAGKLRSEAWAWTDNEAGVLVAKYNDDNIENSLVAVESVGEGKALHFGGAGLSLYCEPRGATYLGTGKSFTFGTTYYFLFDGGWPQAYELYRTFLEGKGHGIPKDYAPPLNWNELFDVGWYHSNREELFKYYTRDALLKEAAKAAEIGCDLLYLDPGWEVCEGTTLWDAERLGTVRDFVRELREKYGLRLGYRTIGRVYRDEFPNAWYIRRQGRSDPYSPPRIRAQPTPEPVPLRKPDGRRNLALLPGVKILVSSTIPGYDKLHRPEHLNDGWYNNPASWISAEDPSWVELDLGTEYRIDEIALGSEHTAHFRDRSLRRFSVWVRTASGDWQTVLTHLGPTVHETTSFRFQPTVARFVRVLIHEAGPTTARIDELEVYEAEPGTGPEPFRRPVPEAVEGDPIGFWEVCTLNKAWQAEKLKRILTITGQGVDFMMFDEFDWRGPCYDPSHGHPVPSTPEGHVRAVYGLVEGMRRRYPHVLVEAHDPVWPWSMRYLPTYFRQGFEKSRYQENWGFEFMWNPIEDLLSGRALCLYYYNLGCPVPLYDHITMEADNDACLSFWWYASTVRHLGIGGKKGLNSPAENEARWQAYKKAVAEYNRLREYYARGRFVGLEETVHVHLHPYGKSAVVNVFNLTRDAVRKEVRFPAALLRAKDAAHLACEGAASQPDGDDLLLTFELPPLSPAHAVVKLE